MIKTIWRWFWRPAQRLAWGAIFIFGGFAGIIFWGGFNTAMEYTNTMEFCISCHEMRSTVYQEYKKTVHFKNASGVQAVCSDCHVPKAWTPKLIRKIQATNELYHKAVGTISTPEKFEAKRLIMAERVDAQRAHQVGLVNKVVARDDLMAEAEKAARRICELSPVAVQGMKESMVRGATLDYNAIDQITDWIQTRVMNSQDRKEGVRAFAKREKVDWPGR